MKIALFALAVAAFAQSATAQDDITTRPSIVVVGEGVAEQLPDLFRVSAEIHGAGSTQVEALRELAQIQTSVTAGMRELDGLETARVTTSGPRVDPIRASGCAGRYDEDATDCRVTGYSAVMTVQVEGSPVARAGDAVSISSERGARSARLDTFDIAEPSALQARANQMAFQDARRQAEEIAAAAGQRVIRILRISQPGARNVGAVQDQVEEIVVTGSRITPTVSLDIAPPPVTATARLTVVFEIE